MGIVVKPEELRAWRKRLGLSQAAVARQAGTDRERVSFVETKVVGLVTTYIAINEALVSLEAEQQTQTQKAIAA